MSSLFGIPLDVLVVVLGGMFAAILAASAVFALRNPILLKLGLRKIPRSPGRSVLIVAGLMLATTIITAALSTGDTMAHTFRGTAETSLGHIDEVVASARFESETGQTGTDAYFDETVFDQVAAAAAGLDTVEGTAPAIMDTVAVQSLTTQLSEPRVGLFAVDPAYMSGFGVIRTVDGATVTLGDLGPDEVYVNRDLGNELDASAGHEVAILTGGEPRTFRIAGIVDYEGTGTADEAVLLPLAVAQELLGVPGSVNRVLISNEGGPLDGAQHTDEVVAALEPAVEGTGLDVHPVKQDAIDLADEVATAFTGFFATFGMFSIVAGILLIFLLFVMLAAERRPEMGIARAIGTQRSQVIRMFLYEGLVYDVAAAALGAAAGVGVAFLMVFALAQAFGTLGVDIEHDVRARSLAVAFFLGVILTFVTVTVSAWRVSSLNIVAAVRNLPDRGDQRGGRRRWWLGLVALLIGGVVMAAGVTGEQYGPFALGLTLAVAGTVPLLRRAGVPDRLAFTIPGVVIVVWFLLPSAVTETVLPELAIDFSAFVIFGVAVILGATWVVMFNTDLIVAAVVATVGRVPTMAPVVKTAVSRPLANRFRTGMTIAMFGLVVLTVVITSVTTTSIANALDNVERYGGGFDMRASVLPTTPIEDMGEAINANEGVDASAFERIASQSTLAVEARQVGTGQEFERFPVFGFDDEFLGAEPYAFSTRAHGYDSDAAVWEAMRADPGLAVVTAIAVPTRENLGFGAGLPDFQLEGFYLEDEGFQPVEVEVRDPQSGAAATLTIIGVLTVVTPQEFLTGIVAHQGRIAETFGAQANPTAFWFSLQGEAAPDAVAADLEAAFLGRGMEVDVMQDVLDEVVASNRTFTYLVQGFLGLGLVVGVAALAVVSARSVVERHRDLAVLRSIGFQRSMIYLLVVVETSLVALIGLVLGVVLGLAISYNLVSDIAGQPSWRGVEFTVPWLELAALFVVVYAAAVLTSLLPARRAANVYPAEALRYE